MSSIPFGGPIEPDEFPRVIGALFREGATGSLKVEGPGYRKALYYRGGRILFGSSNDPRDQLGAILVQNGTISVEQFESVAPKVGPGSPLARVLADSGLVGQRELSEAARVKVERILADILTYTSGTFEFEDSVLPKGAVDLRLSTPRLYIAAAKAADAALLTRVLGPAPRTLRLRAGTEATLAEVDADAIRVARSLDGQRALRTVSQALALDEGETERVACGLVLLGLVEHVPHASAEGSAATERFDPFTLLTDSSTEDTKILDSESLSRGLEGMEARVRIAEPPPSTGQDQAELFLEDAAKTVLFPAESAPLQGSAQDPVFSTGAGHRTKDLSLDLDRTHESLTLGAAGPASPPIEIDIEPEPTIRMADVTPPTTPRAEPPPADVAPAEPTIRMPSPVAPPPRQRERVLTPPPIALPPRESLERAPTEPPFFRPETPMGPRPIKRAPVPLMLLGALALGAIAAGVWYWLGTSGRPSAPVAVATAAPTPLAMPTPQPTPTAVAATAPAATPATVEATPPSATPETPPEPTEKRKPKIDKPASRKTEKPPAPKGEDGGDARELLRKGEVGAAAVAFLRATKRDGYTIQLLVACSPDTVVKAVSRVASSEIYVLPLRFRGRDCHRVLWGHYASEDQAEAALRRSLPDYFTQETSKPRVEPMADVLR